MAPGASWRCCFRPQVAEGSQGGEQIAVAGKGGQKLQQDKCTEDSANAEIFSRLHCRPIQTSHEIVEDAEEFASPASSYQTCFSEQDPTDFGEFSRRNSICSVTDEAPISLAEPANLPEADSAAAAATPAAAPAAAAAAEEQKAGTSDSSDGKVAISHRPAAVTTAAEKQQRLPFHPAWMDTELGRPPARRRDRLPQHNHPLPSVNIWSIVKDWIGKDLHKLTLPTHVNEPLTDLQRRAEVYDSSHVLDEAALMPAKSLDRLVHIAAFATSMYNTVKRVQKPFKDLQNGTYELVYPEKRLRLIGEKASHIPWVNVLHCEGAGWQFDGNDVFNMSLWGNHAIIKPHGELYVKFHDGDEYVWNTVDTYVNNLLVGKRYLDHRGTYQVTQLSTGDYFKLKISEPIFGKSTHEVRGCLVKADGTKVENMTIAGKWDGALFATYPNGTRKELWRAKPPHPHTQNTLHPFPLFAVHMNELTPELRAKLPPTDGRLRPDMRLFEHGLFHEANDEKMRLEEKQRQERNAAEAAGKSFGDPIWFYKVPGGRRGFETWRYKGGYWEAREKGDWSMCRDIYGPGPKGMKPAELLY